MSTSQDEGMMILRTVTLVLGADGQLQIICGGEVAPVEGVNACRAAADWFQEQGVQAEVRRRVEEMRRDGAKRPETEDRGPKAESETPMIDG